MHTGNFRVTKTGYGSGTKSEDQKQKHWERVSERSPDRLCELEEKSQSQ